MVTNKEKIECVDQCQSVTIQVQSCPVMVDFYVLPKAACSLVLCIQWLATLGLIETDYSQLKMSFKKDSILYTLHEIRQLSLKALSKKECPSTIFLLQLITPYTARNISSYPLELDRLLTQFKLVYQTLITFQPQRPHDHRIPILPNNQPINVRPYRYPHYQKLAIEQMVWELLHSGLIRPSNSPFSSSFLFVKKASGEWQFSVDY